ncbi:MAG: CPBP family intramembrane metalloprotease [Clostridia bacterium]|nr:CPBP family intramembrane metalloprotease [Clostridia bacterium]
MNEKKYELRKQIKSVRWMIFWVVLAQFAAELAVEAVASFMEKPPHEYILIAIVEVLAIGVPIMVYARSVWNGGVQHAKKEFWLNPCKPSVLVIAALLGITGQFVMILLNMPANYYVQEILGQTQEDAIPMAFNVTEVILGIFAVVVIPAALEEFWMRGIIFCAYNKSNTYAAIFFTSLIFALLHMRLNEMAGFLLMGIVASVVLIKCNSLYASMVYHAFSNLTALLLGFVLPLFIDYIWIVFVVAVIIFAGLFVLMLMQKNRVSVNRHFKGNRLVLTSIFSMPVIFSIAVAVAKYLLIKM